MQHRPGRSLAVGGLAVACVAALGLTTASTASAAPASASGKKPLKLTAKALGGAERSASELTAPAGGARTASTRIAAAYGGYPLHTRTLTTKVAAPLQLSVTKKYVVLVGDAGANKLLQVVRGGNVKTLFTGPRPADEISGVAVSSDGSIAYTSSNYAT